VPVYAKYQPSQSGDPRRTPGCPDAVARGNCDRHTAADTSTSGPRRRHGRAETDRADTPHITAAPVQPSTTAPGRAIPSRRVVLAAAVRQLGARVPVVDPRPGMPPPPFGFSAVEVGAAVILPTPRRRKWKHRHTPAHTCERVDAVVKRAAPGRGRESMSDTPPPARIALGKQTGCAMRRSAG